MTEKLLEGTKDPAPDSGYPQPPRRMGFFTDTSVCIGCKACEVACKEWNLIPDDGFSLLGMSYDNTGMLGADTWRHVAFIEQDRPLGRQNNAVALMPTGPSASAPNALMVAAGLGEEHGARLGTETGAIQLEPNTDGKPRQPVSADGRTELRWLMASDVCKHCTHAACLDVCPTGSLFRTEFGTVVVQEDICNGCGYCVPACPYGVIDQRKDDGRVWKCTLCYDRMSDGQEPACAKACPTESIQYGPLDELRERAAHRVARLHDAGVADARLYGADPDDGVGGTGAFFLLLDKPEVYGFPPDPVVTTRDLPAMWRHTLFAAVAVAATALAAFAGARR
ncbi:formate dehydrogenase iron-sulfur subunit [Micromonospora pattaloongensis]|uniref:Formate dehydrogenase iron-sulfur subunit n=1 Tax=Micromonospora pattaloongensis TaxID=405436 RepID=A0A1H3R530_9ACTN|nr:4Fe-4S dicluster domain-containing protein [Micromonospora pattaloongensis]SDZ20797.1 formate dehydrogenase iron-sulfur subunit [Micromonospora pattaloongensis]